MKKFLNFKKGDFWKEHKSKVIIPLVLLLSIALLSVIGVAANTVPYTVIDGEENFVVSIIFPDEKVLAEKAEEIGLNPVSELDDLILGIVILAILLDDADDTLLLLALFAVFFTGHL